MNPGAAAFALNMARIDTPTPSPATPAERKDQ
jgi:hypothetical protein